MKSYLYFSERDNPGYKTKRWVVKSGEKIDSPILANILWYTPWRKYCAVISGNQLTFDAGCLRELASFCENETTKHRAKEK